MGRLGLPPAPKVVVVLVLAFERSCKLSDGVCLWDPEELLPRGGRIGKAEQQVEKADSSEAAAGRQCKGGRTDCAALHKAVEMACVASSLPLVLIPSLLDREVGTSMEAAMDTATSLVRRAVGSNHQEITFVQPR